MKKHCTKMRRLFLILIVLTAAGIFLPASAKNVQAAKTGFVTSGGKTYYYDTNGKKHTGWLTLNGKTYYFYGGTGVMATGWVKNSAGQLRYFYKGSGVMATGWVTSSTGGKRYFYKGSGIMATGWVKSSTGGKRYFYKGSGIMATGWVKSSTGAKRYFYSGSGLMATGWVKNSSGQYRYFDTSGGLMYTGLKKISTSYYYFDTSNGVRAQSGFLTVSGTTYYFGSDGKAQTGWLTISGQKYYFGTTGAMYVDKTATISGKSYSFDSNGVATELPYVLSGDNVKVYENGRNYLLVKEYIEHPGIADGTVSDLELLAAICDAEAGGQGLIGMEAVALTILNRTIKTDKEFPSTLRYVIYQGVSFPQYSPVRDGALLRRLKGSYENRTLAYRAAQEAMNIFNAYVKNGTKRTLSGFTTKDFNYMYFMTDTAFKKQNLDFDKIESYTYTANGETHVFFVDWISPS